MVKSLNSSAKVQIVSEDFQIELYCIIIIVDVTFNFYSTELIIILGKHLRWNKGLLIILLLSLLPTYSLTQAYCIESSRDAMDLRSSWTMMVQW